MNTAIVMLGSNLDPEFNLNLAKEKIADSFEIIKFSNKLVSKPVGEKYHNDFHNESIMLLSVETIQETILIFKDIEKQLGRTADSKQKGEIPIDIDLIFWNDVLVHDDYNRFDFVKRCVDEIK